MYPVENAAVLALRRLESAALDRSLAADNRPAARAWAARALAFRRERFALLLEPASAYERGTEMKEGLAQYVEMTAAGHDGPLLPPEEFPAQAVRLRAYASGCAVGLVLDRLDSAWKRRLEEKDDVSAAEVLHTRWIKLGNSSGSIEVLDRHCQTEGAGKHPLFEGVARATITGLPSEPRIEETDGAVKLSENGLTLTLCGARVTRDGKTRTITLASQPRSRREESPRGGASRRGSAALARGQASDRGRIRPSRSPVR